MEAISHAGTAMGILAKDGVMLAAEKKILSKLLDARHAHEKIFVISEYAFGAMKAELMAICSDIICAVAGITSDANILIDYARLTCQRYHYNYHEPIPVEQLVQAICNLKQSYTQHGGMRPFGASFLWAGWDKVHGFQLYQSDPSGNYGGWKATCIGANNTTAQSIFKSDYEEDSMTVLEAKKLLVKVLGKTVESATIVGEKLEYVLMERHDDQTVVKIFSPQEIDLMVSDIQSLMESS